MIKRKVIRLAISLSTTMYIFASAVLFLASQIAIAFILTSGNVGKELLMLQLTFDASDFSHLLNGLNQSQFNALSLHFYLDFIHSVWYTAFVFCLTSWLLLALNKLTEYYWVLYLSFVMGLLDIVENVIHLPSIFGYVETSEFLVAFSGVCASFK